MKTFLFLLALGYVSSDKLDLTYLPPPGSQYSGGRPGDIQIPLEFPKQTYSTTLRPQTGDTRPLNPEDIKATIGIDRVPGVPDASIVTPGLPPLSQFPNTQRVPSTTVSYAFTQTTTHPPTEGFETTVGPQFTGAYPTDGLSYEGNLDTQNQPGYQQAVNQFGEPTGPAYNNLLSQQPGLGYEGNLQGGNAQSRPGYQQTVNQFGQPILAPTSRPTSQFTGSPTGQQFSGQTRPGQQQVNQFQPGYQQTVIGNQPGIPTTFEQNQYRNQTLPGIGNQPGFVPSTIGPQGFTTASQPGVTLPNGNIAINIPGSATGIPQGSFPGQQVPINGYQPGTSVQPGQIPIGQQDNINRPIAANQQFPGSQFPNQRVGQDNRQNIYQPSSTVAPSFTPGFPSQQYPGSSIAPGFSDEQYLNNGNVVGQQTYPGSQALPGALKDGQNVFQPSSTATPTFTPGIANQGFPTSTSVSSGVRDQEYPTSIAPGSYPTPAYPGSQANAASLAYSRPERPQAEADRNAMILNYDKVITPEGYAYSYDTSNGIHADENGTTIDGTKAEGSYSYIGDDGKLYSVVYTADEDGFQPRGDHIPTPPPIPEAIQRIIEKAEKEKEAGISHDGFYDENKYGHKKYHGAKGRLPQSSQKTISHASEVPEDRVTGTMSQQAQQRPRTQSGQRKPADGSDYYESSSEPGFVDDEYTTVDGKRKPGQKATQRPYVTVDSEDIEGGDLESIPDVQQQFDQRPTNRPFIEVSSRRPINQSDGKQYNKINVPSSERTVISSGDRRRPTDRIPSSQKTKQEQDYEEYIENEEPEYNEEGDKNRYVNKGVSRRPINKLKGDQYDEEYTTASDNYDDEKSSKRPSTSGPQRRPGTNIPSERQEVLRKQTFDKYGRPISKIPSRRPNGSNKLNAQSDVEENDTERVDGKKPSTFFSDGAQTETEEYDSEDDYVTKSPSRLRPSGISTSNKSGPRNKNFYFGKRRRPTSPGLKVQGLDVTDENDEYQPEDGEEYSDLNVSDETEGQRYDNLRPSKPSKGSYDEDDKLDDEKLPRQGTDVSKPRDHYSTKYGGTRGRPQISQTTDDRIQTSGGKRIQASKPGTKLRQKITQPSFTRKPDSFVENRPINGSGYQYIPPQRQFEESGDKSTPNRFTGTPRRPYTGRPTPSTTYYDDGVRPNKPFMTPNVALTGQEIDQEPGRLPINEEQGVSQYDKENDSQYPDGGSTVDQEFEDEVISSTRPPSKYAGSTNRPVTQQTTGRPYTQRVPGSTNDRVTQKGKPSQVTDRYYEDGKTPYRVSSTTPMPSSRPYGSTSRPARPGQQNRIYQNVPGQHSISSTTPLPSQSPTDELYKQDTIQPQYQTTYRPQRPTVGPTDSDVSITPGVPKGIYKGKLPSTTYRPNYTITGQNQPTSRPGVQIDRYGIPINKPGSDVTVQEYIPGITQPSSTARPVGVDIYGRPISPGIGSNIQEFIPGDQNVPSSTASPGVLVDAFGRPVSNPSFGTTVQGYSPNGQTEVSSTARPGVEFDRFGRPINKPGVTLTDQKYIGGGENQPSSTTRPGAIVDAFGRPIPPGSRIQQYVPGSQVQPSSTARPGVTVDAYGRPILGSTPGISSPSGFEDGLSVQQAYEQGIPVDQGQYQTNAPTSSPTYLRGQQKYQPGFDGFKQPVQSTAAPNFQSSTQRIIGEDFSGPKQQQKFDPETGYYYK